MLTRSQVFNCLALIGLLFVAGFFSFWCLNFNPARWFDEGIYLQVVQAIIQTGRIGLELAPGGWLDGSLISVGYPVFYPAALAAKVFGANFMTLRLTAVIFIFIFLVSAYFLTRQLYGQRLALVTLFLLVTFSPLYGHGKNLLGEVPGLGYFVAALLLLSIRQPDNSARGLSQHALAGILLGLAASAKPTYLVMLPAVLVALIINWRTYFNRSAWKAVAAGIAGVGAALWLWQITQFGDQVSLARVFSHYQNPYYVSAWWPVISSNLWRLVRQSTPAHFLLLFLAALWLLAGSIRRRERPTVAELSIVLFAVFTLIFYVRTAGWYRYFFPAQALLFIIFPAAVVQASRRMWRGKFYALPVIIIFGLALAQFWPLWSERLSCRSDAVAAFGSSLIEIFPGEPVLFASLPALAANYSGNARYQYLRMSEQLQLGGEILARAEQGFFQRIFLDESLVFRPPACYTVVKSGFKVSEYRKVSELCQ